MSKTYNNSILNKLISKACDGRLTLESGVPVSTTDQTAKTTVYFTPYNGNTIGLYDGSEWDLFTFTELSLSLSGLAANTNYDIFVFNNNGTITLESTAWTNDSTRATALTTQDGIYVKNGANTRKYLGTIRTTSTIGQCEDSSSRRLVWNTYNKEARSLKAYDATFHTYSSSTVRAWNANTTLGQARADFVSGLSDTYLVSLIAQGHAQSVIGIGVDTTTAISLNAYINTAANTIRSGISNSLIASAGYHYININENSAINATTASFSMAEISMVINI